MQRPQTHPRVSKVIHNAFVWSLDVDRLIISNSGFLPTQRMTCRKVRDDMETKAWCGIIAIAAIADLPTSKVKHLIKKHRRNPETRVIGTDIDEVCNVLAKIGYNVELAYFNHGGRMPYKEWVRNTRNEREKNVAYLMGVTDPYGNEHHWCTVLNGKYICSVTKEWVPITKNPCKGWNVDYVVAAYV